MLHTPEPCEEVASFFWSLVRTNHVSLDGKMVHVCSRKSTAHGTTVPLYCTLNPVEQGFKLMALGGF